MIPRQPFAVDTRRDLVWLVAVAALLFLPALGARDLWNPNEPLYGRAVVEMLESGDWSIPTFNGQPFAEKPILYFWLSLGVSSLLGSATEWTLRLPSAAAGLLGVAMLYLLARSAVNRSRARIAALLFMTTYIVFWTARSLQMDLLVSVTTLGAVLAAYRAIERSERVSWGWVGFGAATGLGVLAKGPVGAIVPILVLGGYLSITGLWRRVAPLGALVGFGIAVAISLPWFAWLVATGKWDFLHEMLIRQNFTRYVHPWDHDQPWWYFGLYFWIDMAPWACFVPLAAGRGDRSPAERRIETLCWIWIAAIVLFFSLSASKRSPYILPVAPAVAILASGPIERWIGGRLTRRRGLVLLGTIGCWALTFAGLSAYILLFGPADFPEIRAPLIVLGVTLALGAAGVAFGLLRSASLRWSAPAALWGAFVAVYVVAGWWVLPSVDRYKSARPFCERLNQIVSDDAPVRSYRSWRWRGGYVYYADREIPTIETEDRLREYWTAGGPVFLIVESDRIDEARRVLGPAVPLIERAVGSRKVYLFTNDRSTPAADRPARGRRSRAGAP